MKNLVGITLLTTMMLCCQVIVLAQDSGTQDNTATTTQSSSQLDTRIPRNSKVFISYMGGFETYLAAAIRKKGVPLLMVTDPDMADFVIEGTHETKNAGWAKTIFLGDIRPQASASMQVVNRRTKVVVYADSSHRSSANRGERSTAEKLAKYLKKKIEDDEKKKK